MSRTDVFNPRRNNFTVLRLVLAGMVAASHGIVIATGSQLNIGSVTLGDVAVDSFFVLSGFLVARSYLRLDDPLRFAWHRFLRIMPGFWVCLLVVALVAAPGAALLEGRGASTPFVAEPSPWGFLLGNAVLLIRQYDIAGLLAGNPTSSVFVGSLWTLALEALCYGILAALGLLGALRNRGVVLGLTLLTWVALVLQDFGVAVPLGDNVLRFLLLFLLGACAYLYGDRIPLRSDLAVGATVAVVAAVLLLGNYRVRAGTALVFTPLWLAIGPHGTRRPGSTCRTASSCTTTQRSNRWSGRCSAAHRPWSSSTSLWRCRSRAVVSWHGVERPAFSWKNVSFPHWLRLPLMGSSPSLRQES